VDAVFIVLNSGRLAQEFKKSIKLIMDWLHFDDGKNFCNFRFIITHCEDKTSEEQAALKEELKQLLGINKTLFKKYFFEGRIEKREIDLVYCVGFPKRLDHLSEAGKDAIVSSWKLAFEILRLPAKQKIEIERSRCLLL
jgi:hypothetical protein